MMTNGTNVSQRDIVLIPFPYSDLSQNKKRPVIILSNTLYNQKNEDFICCAITSNHKNYEGSVKFNSNDLESGSIPYESRIKPGKVFTLNQDKVIKKLAKLNIIKSKEVVEELNIFIEIEE